MAKKKSKSTRKYQAGGENRASEKRAQSSMKTYQKPSAPEVQRDTTKTVGSLRLEKKRKGGSMKRGY